MNDGDRWGFYCCLILIFLFAVGGFTFGMNQGVKKGRAHGLEIKGMEIDCGIDFQIKYEEEWFVYNKPC